MRRSLQQESTTDLKLLELFRRADISPRIFSLPMLLVLVAALFDSISIGLFVPILKGLATRDYSFLQQYSLPPSVLDYLNEFASDDSLRPFFLLSGLVGIALLMKNLSAFFAKVVLFARSELMAHKLRTKLFGKMLYSDKSFFDTMNVGELHNTVSLVSNNVAMGFFGLCVQFSHMVPAFFYAAILFVLSWQATVIALLLGPVFLWVVKPAIRRIAELSHDAVHSRKHLDKIVGRVFSSIELVKANSTEARELGTYTIASKEYSSRRKRSLNRGYAVDLMLQLGILGILGAALCLLIAFVGREIAVNFTRYVVYLYLLKRIIDIIHLANHLRASTALLEGQIAELTDALEDPRISELRNGEQEFSGLNSEIRIEDLSFSYNEDLETLKNVSLTFKRGETTALVGRSGAGKTTIAQLLLRLYDCPPETIFFDDTDIRELELCSLHAKMAYVNQSGNVFHATLHENLCYGIDREISSREISEAIRDVEMSDMVASLPDGLDTFIGERGVKVSGGEAQRIAIARAMLKKVEIIILDEATSALDASTEQSVQAAFDRLSEGKTVVVIAHRFSTLRKADKIVAIENGTVVEQGSQEELLANDGLFAQLWSAQRLAI